MASKQQDRPNTNIRRPAWELVMDIAETSLGSRNKLNAGFDQGEEVLVWTGVLAKH